MQKNVFSRSFVHLISLLICLLLTSCFSLLLDIQLPESGKDGILSLRYELDEGFQNISNYPSPRDDIAPMPLPLLEWDFKALAAQSQSIELLSYDFQPAKSGDVSGKGIVEARLSFRSPEDLVRLLGNELQWRPDEKKLTWKLDPHDLDEIGGDLDSSYGWLGGSLSLEEEGLVEEFFANRTLRLRIENGNKASYEEEVSLVDLILGRKNLNVALSW